MSFNFFYKKRMLSLEEFLRKYRVDKEELIIGGKKFCFYVPSDISEFIDKEDPLSGFPLWARIWEGAIVLSEYILNMNIPKSSFLEIGAGIGVSGIVAASAGHNVTITDYSKDALCFAYANALKNLKKTENVKVMLLDWRDPKIEERYDYIIGSEVVYKEEDFDPLMELFKKALRKGGTIIISETIRKSSLKFLEVLSKYYSVKARIRRLRSEKEETSVILAEIRS